MAENNVDLLEMFGPPDNGTVTQNEDGTETVSNVITSTPDQVDLGAMFGEPDALPEGSILSDIPELRAAPNYGKRADGTNKGRGFLGELKTSDGKVATELSIGVEFDGKPEREIPLLVPTLTQDEVDSLLAGNAPSDDIIMKAVTHARGRIAEGKSVFAENEMPVSNLEAFQKRVEMFTDDLMVGVYGRDQLQEFQESAKKIDFFMSRAPRIALMYVAPLYAVAYEALDQGKNVLVSQLKGEKYDPLERRILSELLPDSVPGPVKILSSLGETLVDIALVGGAMNAAKQGTLGSAVKEIVIKMQRQGIDISKGRIPTKQEIAQAAKGTTLEKTIKAWWRAKKIDLGKLMKKQIKGPQTIKGPVNNSDIEILTPLPKDIAPQIVRDATGKAIVLSGEAIDKAVKIAAQGDNLDEAIAKIAPVSKEEVTVSPEDEKMYLKEIRTEISDGEPGYRMPVENGVWMSVGSTYPEYFKNKGYTKSFALNAIDKYLNGDALGSRQEEFINDMKEAIPDKAVRDLQFEREDQALAKAQEEQIDEGDISFDFGANLVKKQKALEAAKKEPPKYKKPTHVSLITAQNRYAELLGVKKMVEPLEIGKMKFDQERWTLNNEISQVVKNLKKLKTVTPEQMAVALNTNVEAPKNFGEKEKAIFDYFRSLTRTMLERTNEVRARTGREPIKDIGAYFRHVLDREASEILKGTQPMPERLKEWADKNITGEVRNPMELERKISDKLLETFSNDLEEVMKITVHTALKEIHLDEAKKFLEEQIAGAQIDKNLMENMTPAEKVAYLAQEELPKETKQWLEDYVKIVLLDEKQTTIDQKTNQWLSEGKVGEFIDRQLQRFGKHLTDRAITNALVAVSKIPLYGVIGGFRPKLLLRNKMQIIQNTALYGIRNAIRGTFPTSDYPVLEKLKSESLFLSTYSGIEELPADLKGKISRAMMASFQRTAISNVNQAMNSAYHWTAQMIQDPKFKSLGWADPKRTYTEGPNFFYPSELQFLQKEMEYGAQTTQYQYIGMAMPEIFRYKTAAPLTRLQSWWMNHWGVFLREAATRAITGKVGYTVEVTYKGAGPEGINAKVNVSPGISVASRVNFLKYLIFGGLVLNTLGYGKSFVFGTAPTGVPPAAQIAMSMYHYFTTSPDTAYGRNERRIAVEKMKSAALTFIPGYLTYKDISALMSGEKPWQEYLFYNKTKKSGKSSSNI